MMNSFIVSSVLLVLVDSIYLYFIGKPVFDKTVSAIQNSALVVGSGIFMSASFGLGQAQ